MQNREECMSLTILKSIRKNLTSLTVVYNTKTLTKMSKHFGSLISFYITRKQICAHPPHFTCIPIFIYFVSNAAFLFITQYNLILRLSFIQLFHNMTLFLFFKSSHLSSDLSNFRSVRKHMTNSSILIKDFSHIVCRIKKKSISMARWEEMLEGNIVKLAKLNE